MAILTDDQKKALSEAIASYYMTWGQRSCYNSRQDVLRATHDDGFDPIEYSGIELDSPVEEFGEAWDKYLSEFEAELDAIDEEVRKAIDSWFTTRFDAKIIDVE